MMAFCKTLSIDPSDPPLAGRKDPYPTDRWDQYPIEPPSTGPWDRYPLLTWRPHLSEPYVGSWQNEWPMQVYECVVQLMRELNEDNATLIEVRYVRIRQDYFRLKDTPRKTYGGPGGGEYERAFNKAYYSK